MMVFSGHQPNFLPYMGVFYKIFKSDVFVLDDDVQYSNDGMHNCNFLKVQGKKAKVIVPVSYNYGDRINEVKICNKGNWKKKLLKTLQMNYHKAKHFEEGYEFIKKYLDRDYEYLCDMNVDMIKEIAHRFKLKAEIVIASKWMATELKKNERNVAQCIKSGCNVYYSGTGGKSYNDESMYEKNGIEIVYSDYKPVEYNQIGEGFVENLSILDYIMNEGFKNPWEQKQPFDMEHACVTL